MDETGTERPRTRRASTPAQAATALPAKTAVKAAKAPANTTAKAPAGATDTPATTTSARAPATKTPAMPANRAAKAPATAPAKTAATKARVEAPATSAAAKSTPAQPTRTRATPVKTAAKKSAVAKSEVPAPPAPVDLQLDSLRQVWKPPRRQASGPSASATVADLWSQREEQFASPDVHEETLPADPLARPVREKKPKTEKSGKTGLIAGVVAVAVLLGGGLGAVLANSGGGGAPSKAKFIAKADAICAGANTSVASVGKPTSYPELGTALGSITSAADAQTAALGKLALPGGPDGVGAKAVFSALAATGVASHGMQTAVTGKDDGATAKAATQMSHQFADAAAQAQAYGFAACGAGMRGGMDNVMGGTKAVIKTDFLAKADSLCRAAGRNEDAIPAPTKDPRDIARAFTQALQISNTLIADLKALPVPPGDETVVSEMMAAQDKVLASFAEMRDALLANDARRYTAVTAEESTNGTAADAKFDAYGLAVCGSNFGG